MLKMDNMNTTIGLNLEKLEMPLSMDNGRAMGAARFRASE
jgi:hypothetical protein